MPPRHYVAAILLFWGATTAWLFQRDLWPRLRPGEAPPFAIDLAYEARGAAASTWRILRGDTMIGRVHTEVGYRESDDTFELRSLIIRLDLGTIGPLHIKVEAEPSKKKLEGEQQPGMTGMYRVTREGELREIVTDATVHVGGTGIARALNVTAHVHLDGHTAGSRFFPAGFVEVGGMRQDLGLEPVPLQARESVLNPLHPVNRITGLHPGQHWEQRLVDPLADALAALVQKDPGLRAVLPQDTGVKTLQAVVLPETQRLPGTRGGDVCLVIEYRANDLVAHTWVRERDGKVLRQEATLWGERLVLERL